jgi:DNA-binding NarL/FixJ family response regulator
MQRIEAFLIDSNKLFREGLKRLLDESPFHIVAEAGNLREGVAIAEAGLRPQLVLLDLVNGGGHCCRTPGWLCLRPTCAHAVWPTLSKRVPMVIS